MAPMTLQGEFPFASRTVMDETSDTGSQPPRAGFGGEGIRDVRSCHGAG